MERVKIFGIVAMLVGCSGQGTFEYKAHQADAEEKIWRTLYGENGPTPPVEWRVPQCTTSGGELGVYGYNIGSCTSGFYWLGGGIVVVDDPDKTNWQALAHEWLHAHSWLRTGDADPKHFRENWDLPFYAAFRMIDLESADK